MSHASRPWYKVNGRYPGAMTQSQTSLFPHQFAIAYELNAHHPPVISHLYFRGHITFFFPYHPNKYHDHPTNCPKKCNSEKRNIRYKPINYINALINACATLWIFISNASQTLRKSGGSPNRPPVPTPPTNRLARSPGTAPVPPRTGRAALWPPATPSPARHRSPPSRRGARRPQRCPGVARVAGKGLEMGCVSEASQANEQI